MNIYILLIFFKLLLLITVLGASLSFLTLAIWAAKIVKNNKVLYSTRQRYD